MTSLKSLTLLVGATALAGVAQATPIDLESRVTEVSRLTDVRPDDWAFSALQSLVERYGCLAGYPDRRYLGQRALTRHEFAAGLNSCLTKIQEILAAGLADKVSQDDIATLQRLQEEFATEIGTIKGRIDGLESRVAVLERQQFSPVVKLGGEVVFGPAGATDSNVVLPYVARLGLVASFTGNDRLRLGLQSANFGNANDASVLGFGDNLRTQMALLSFQSTTNNNFAIDNLEYRFPAFDDRVVFTIRPAGFSLASVLTTNSPYFDIGRGSISRFAEASPLFKIGNLTAGAGFDWLLNDQARLQVAYGSRDSASPTTAANNTALGIQLLTKPTDNLWAGIGYINAYSSTGNLGTITGSFNADNSGFIGASQINAISGTLNWAVSPNVRLGAWGGWTFSDAVNSTAYANSTTYLFSVGLSEPFGRQGDLLAFLFGQPLKLTDGRSATGANISDRATGLHYEIFYRYRLNRNISITPGFFVVTNPDHASGRDAIFVGTVRTVFRF